MKYNLYFDVCAIVIYIVAIAYLCLRKSLREESNQVFLALLMVCELSCVADIVSAALNSRPYRYSVHTLDFWHNSYLILHCSMAFISFIYVLMLIGHFKEMKGIFKLIYSIPYVVSISLILLNPLNYKLYYYDADGFYTHGILFFLLYFNALLYLAVGVLYCVLYRKKLTKREFTLMMVFAMLCIFPVVYQLYNPALLIELFCQALGLFGILVCIENDDELLNIIFGIDKDRKRKWLFTPSFGSILLIIISVGINILGRKISTFYVLPFWLDTIGTFIVAIMLGPIAGAITGIVSNSIIAIKNPVSFWYLFVSAGVGIIVGIFFPRNRKNNSFMVISTAVIAGLAAAILSSPFNMIFYKGYTGNIWGNGLFDMLSGKIDIPIVCCIISEAFVDMPDKMVSLLLALILIKVMEIVKNRILITYRRINISKIDEKESKGSKSIIKSILIIVSVSLISATSFSHAEETVEQDYASDYETILYDSEDGLISSEINAIAQTTDGYIWVGSYSGIYRYDGSHFEKMNLDEHICNVMVLYATNDNGLYIGTNDHGVAYYNCTEKTVKFYTVKEGMPSDSIRAFSEDDKGNLYVGTSGAMCCIKKDGTIRNYSEWSNISYTRSLTGGDNGIVAGVTNGGSLFFIKDDALLGTFDIENSENVGYAAAAFITNGEYIVGTSSSELYKITFKDNIFKISAIYDNPYIAYYNDIKYDPLTGGVFLCAENGLGYLSPEGEFSDLRRYDFERSVSNVIKDYQGNIWFVSNKQGVVKFSHNPFTDIFKKAGLESIVVNCITRVNETMYIGTDDGVYAIDAVTYQSIESEKLSRFSGTRVRQLYVDNKGSLWVSTYGSEGLVRLDSDGGSEVYNESNGAKGSRFRLVLQLSDGTILAASNIGLTYIKNGKVSGVIGKEDGLNTPQILYLAEKEDGTIMAASDGDGIYLINDGVITGRIGEQQGLETLVVMKIVPYDNGYFYVTSNALYYDDNKEIKKLKHFPYSNNYDIFITEKGTAWITSSAGIYIVNADELINDGEYSNSLLNRSRGFYTTLTANSWDFAEGEYLFLCCSDGVRRISTQNYASTDKDFRIAVSSIISDGEVIEEKNGVYNIPENSSRINIQVSVLDYTLSNPRIRLFLDNTEDEGIICRQNELTQLTYTNLPYGNYRLHVQLLDETEDKVIREEIFELKKNARIFETSYFRTYLFFVCIVFLMFVVWMISKLGSMTTINRQYEQIRLAKEEAETANNAKSRFLANMSHEIRTPINAIKGFDELILKSKTEPEIKQYARDINEASDTLLGIVNDILDISKIESGKLELNKACFNFARMLNSIISMCELSASEKGLAFIYRIDEKLPMNPIGDEVRLKQILMNLLSNAIKYTEKGSVKLTISFEGIRERKALIYVSVKDTGIGIKEEEKERIFEPFERLDEKRNKNIQGTGLGLNITKQLLEIMDSGLEFESEYGKGSDFTFFIALPFAGGDIIGKDSIGRMANIDEPAKTALLNAPDSKILVVDDNKMNLKVTKGLLKRTGAVIDICESGEECLELLKENKYDLIFLDHMMPGLDGVETLKRLKKMGIKTPVIVLTANAVGDVRSEYLKIGFDDYLAKPVTGEVLEKTVYKFLSKEKIKAHTAGEKFAENTPPKEKTGDFMDVLNAEGFSTGLGMRYCANDKDFYKELLLEFASETNEGRNDLNSYYESKDLSNYTVKVHALKNNAKTIGATNLSDMAFELEKAGKSDNYDFIKEKHSDFIAEYERITGIINSLFGDGKENTDES